jgi:NAD(P)-dependent dehydrogenase (short-subunit alcohol dehydrogenase family)
VLLENKNAVIYGGGGSIGGAVARAFAREGARVFLAGRTEARLKEVADDIAPQTGRRKRPSSTRSPRRRSIAMPMRWSPRREASTSRST